MYRGSATKGNSFVGLFSRNSIRRICLINVFNKEEGELNCRKVAERSAYGIAFRITVLNVQVAPK